MDSGRAFCQADTVQLRPHSWILSGYVVQAFFYPLKYLTVGPITYNPKEGIVLGITWRGRGGSASHADERRAVEGFTGQEDGNKPRGPRSDQTVWNVLL